MPDNMIDELFSRLAGLTLPVPDAAGVVDRGRQRRRRSRYMAVAAGIVAAAVAVTSVTVITQALGGNGGHGGPAVNSHRTRPGGQPEPAGTGRLLLGVTASGSFEIGRLGESALEPIRGLRPLAAWHSLVTTDPAGGWVVTYAAGPVRDIRQPERLATVSPTGQVHAFGPVFPVAEITGIAVRPDGSAVAVAVSATPVSTDRCRCKAAQIMLVPLPGHAVAGRTWTLASPTRTMAEDLSWAPGGTRLTYQPGANEYGGGFIGTGAVTLDTAERGTVAPAQTNWPAFSKHHCNMIGGTWAGSQYLALEACGQDLRTELVPASVDAGAFLGAPVLVQGWGCPPPAFSVAADGQVLLSYCGVQERNGASYSYLRGPLTQVAWAGP